MSKDTAQIQKHIEEAGLLIERLDDCFRSEANDSFHNHVGLVKEMTRIVAEHLETIATKSAEVERENTLEVIESIRRITNSLYEVQQRLENAEKR